MPRHQPPEDYYTATQVKKLLNISGAMIAHYVEKGKIRHITPPGRVHGFYLKKDVDKLTNELEATFNLEGDFEAANIVTATEAEMLVIIKGQGEDSIKWQAARQIENMSERLNTIEQHLETMMTQTDRRFDTIETMLTEILARVPPRGEP